MGDKLKALNTIALWIIALMIAGYLIFKPDNTLSKSTVDKLTTVVDNLGTASENMTKLADAQRAWFNDLQKQSEQGELIRNKNYGNVYDKYGYGDNQDTGLSLNDLYNSKLRPQNNDIGSGHLRQVPDGDSKTQPIQKPADKPKGQPH